MSLRWKLWVTVGMLCVSMTAHADYKEVWNPPEAAQKVRHAGHAKPVAAGTANHAKSTPHAKVAASPKMKAKPGKAKVAAIKPAHAPVQAKHVEAAAKPRQLAQSGAPQAAGAQPPRELPPILH